MIDIPWSEERGTFLSHIFFVGDWYLDFLLCFCLPKKTSSSTEGRGMEFGREFGMEAYPSMNSFFRLQKNELLDGTVDFWTENGEFRPAVFTGIVIPARRCGGLLIQFNSTSEYFSPPFGGVGGFRTVSDRF